MSKAPVYTEAEKGLREYIIQKQKAEKKRMIISAIEARMYNPRTVSMGTAPAHGGGNRYDDRMIANIEKHDEAIAEYKKIIACVRGIERRLKALPEDERNALLIYYSPGMTAVRASSILHMSRATFYRLVDRAMKHYIATSKPSND
ncbi:MAG: hypothetical protein VB118_04740 [Oscillospiraceae bacterium]|nr:hypothetical protein [Oscillospiraceae bacterium]